MIYIAICSQQYLGYYNVLYQSLKTFYPNYKQILYYIGNNPPKNFDQVIDITSWPTNPSYNTLESICSLRARVVLDAFKYSDKVCFLGAKVQFFSTDSEIEDVLNNYDAFVTPHILEPLPEDGKFPSNASINWTGHISTDVVAFKNTPEIVKFLTWQDEIMKTQVKTTNYTYLDQSWLNFLPFFVDKVHISRNPAHNVAYWNYKQRYLRKDYNGKWIVWDQEKTDFSFHEPLISFQFSGLDLNDPKSISKHQNRYEAEGDFLNFLQTYARRVREYKNEG